MQEYFVLTYCHTDAKGTYAEVSGIYTTYALAEAARKAKINPEKYWVRASKVVL
jgi:hypothetical protein